jgi:hypothetical protein
MTTLIAAFIAAFVGIASSLLTIFLTPTLQHYLWTRQRLAERQLAVLDEANKITAEVLHHCLADYDTAAAEHRAPRMDPHEPVLLALWTLQGPVRALFSRTAREPFEELVGQIVALGSAVPDRPWLQAVEPVAQTRVKALQALYREIGIRLPSDQR